MNFVYILIQNKQHCNDAVSWPTTSLLRAAFSVMNVKKNFQRIFWDQLITTTTWIMLTKLKKSTQINAINQWYFTN